ncbi:S-layer homology domain-containing protein [Paenibacillus sp. HWE-109]|uniref:S-layer homology domain-containing protein n=1 Tax=Paenibacillus sp. HWE-109 TaxID=1306526 RepID=UPI001EE079BD|nr:S-layer homology domain-containing protein [Paenibacillus sp. HWE-109]UKS24698.1 S-layer homology domain-containing protein [Paenibacillus sp. HWE-109]
MIVDGRGQERFEPSGSITRTEIAALLVRSLGLDDSVGKVPFHGAGNGWQYSAVAAAYEAGLINGYKSEDFLPNKEVTRVDLSC